MTHACVSEERRMTLRLTREPGLLDSKHEQDARKGIL